MQETEKFLIERPSLKIYIKQSDNLEERRELVKLIDQLKELTCVLLVDAPPSFSEARDFLQNIAPECILIAIPALEQPDWDLESLCQPAARSPRHRPAGIQLAKAPHLEYG